MLSEYKRKTNIGVGIGIVVQLIGRALVAGSNPEQVSQGWAVVLIGFGFFIWGCAQYAKAKGHSPWFGGLGVFSIIGLLILVLLPDRHKDSKA